MNAITSETITFTDPGEEGSIFIMPVERAQVALASYRRFSGSPKKSGISLNSGFQEENDPGSESRIRQDAFHDSM